MIERPQTRGRFGSGKGAGSAASPRILTGLMFGGAALAALWLGRSIGASGQGLMTRELWLVLALALSVAIAIRPYVGLFILAAGLTLTDALPPVPVFSNTLLPVVGAMTLGGFFLRWVTADPAIARPRIRGWEAAYAAAAALPLWIAATHPSAALEGEGGNWLLTYLQLAVLLWLTAQLLDKAHLHRTLLWAFGFAATASALVAMGSAEVTSTFEGSVRGQGLTGGPNLTALYSVVAFLFFDHLRATSRRPRTVLLATIGGVFSLVGAAATLSRSGFLLGALAVVLVVLRRKRGRRRVLGGVVVILFALLIIPGIYWTVVGATASPFSGQRTAVVRYELSAAGIAMWLDSPLTGVGVGQFPRRLPEYAGGLVERESLELTPHNLYAGLLSETGFVGLGLLVVIVVRAIKRLRLGARLAAGARNPDPARRDLAVTWLSVIVLLLFAGLTMDLRIEKLLWLSLGAALSFPLRDQVWPAREGPDGFR